MPTTKGKIYLGEQLICHTLTDIETETLAFEQMNVSDLPYCSSKAPTSLRPVQPGHCLSLDGTDDHVVIGSTSDYNFFNVTGVFTFGAWVKLTDHTADDAHIIFGNNGTASSATGVALLYENRVSQGSPKKLRFLLGKGTGGGIYIVAASSSDDIITDNLWHYVTVTGDGSAVTFYVDGVADVTASYTSALGGTNSSYSMQLGATNSILPLDGNMSGVFISDAEASAAQVLGLFNGVTPFTSYRQYNLSESTGTVAIDSSGNGNDGTLVNGPTWTTDNSLPYSWLNQVGYSQRMHFDMSDDCVRLPDDAYNTESSGYFEADVITGSDVASGQAVFGVASSTASGEVLQLRIISGKIAIVEAGANIISGSTTLAANTKYTLKWESTGAAWKLYVGGVEETINVDAGSNTGGWFDGVTSGVTQYAIGCLRKSTGDTAFYGGSIYSASINDGASVISSYTGYGNTDADWTDQTGSNNGTVNGSPDIIYIPRDEATPANDAFGNPLQWSGSAFPRRPEYRGSYAGVFDGVDDYVDTGLEVKDDSEFECLIKKTSSSGTDYPFGTTTDTSNRMQVEERTGVWRCIIGTSSQYIEVAETTGEWGTIKLFANGDVYYNGISQGNTGGTQSSNSVVTASRIIFGARSLSSGAGGWWGGNIAQFKTYRAGVLESQYTLSEGVGATAHDISGNGNDGTITNASTATEGAGFWAGRIDGEANAHNINNGFSLYESGANDLRVPYVSGAAHPSPTVPGGYTLTSQNPAVANSHNDAETTWDVYNIGTGDVPCPESNSNSGLSAIAFDADLTADDSAYMHLATSVLNDRLIAFSADLTGGDKTLAEKYTE